MKPTLLHLGLRLLFVASPAAFAQTAPVITSISAARQVVVNGQALTLSVAAAGTPAPTYQWKHNGRSIPAATSPTYTIADASPTKDGGWYQAVVANDLGTTTSPVIFVNVAVYPAQVLTAGNFGAIQAAVPGDLTNACAVAVGAGHWLALKADGTVTAWGNNTYGQTNMPAGLKDVVEIAACNYASFALRADGSVVAWGDGSFRQTAVPAGLTHVVSIAAGQTHALALKADGTVAGWGWNESGQVSVPANLTDVVGISAGENNSFAWKIDGKAVGWGNNAFGQTSVPASLTNVVDIVSGEDFAVALKDDGTLVSWGASYSGAKVPVGLTNVTSIAAGLYHALAINVDGTVVAWGDTYTGPVKAPGSGTSAVAIAAKDAYSVVLRRTIEGAAASVAGESYTLTTLAGLAGSAGNADGAGGDARFRSLCGIAVDVSGNIFVTDTGNYTVRKVTPNGVVSTLAGTTGASGFADGPGSGARFGLLAGITADLSGNIYIADAGNDLVRKITLDGMVTTLAGSRGRLGSSDGKGGAAQFAVPNGLAADGAGNIYVTDTDFAATADLDGNETVRRITPDGTVTTVAGSPLQYGSADGTGAAARFGSGYVFVGVAVDRLGNIYVSDANTVRKITAGGVVTTLAGQAGSFGTVDGTGGEARFSVPRGLAVDRKGNVFVAQGSVIRRITPDGVVTSILDSSHSSAQFFIEGIAVDDTGNLYLADQNSIIKATPNVAPVITRQPQSQIIAEGSTVVFRVAASSALTPGYRWEKNGVLLDGVKGDTLVIPSATLVDAGIYVCTVTNSFGTVTTSAATLALSAASDVGHIANFSVRSRISRTPPLEIGLVISGSATGATKPVLFRAAGPALSVFGVPDVAADPRLELFSGTNKIGANDNWGGDAQIAAVGDTVGAFSLGAAGSNDAALYQPSLPRGTYRLLITGEGGIQGTAIAEVYDASPASAFNQTTLRLANLSVRAEINATDGALDTGFIVGGQTSKTVLLRAIGPSLILFGLGGALPDPELKIYSGVTLLHENDNWSNETTGTAQMGAAFTRAGAFALDSTTKDAALLITLPPGAYTARMKSADLGTGTALLEIYELP